MLCLLLTPLKPIPQYTFISLSNSDWGYLAG
jgi:hypothetical protein